MEFDKKQLLHLANLAKLELKEENIESYNKQLQDILAYVEKINKLDLKDVEESLIGIEGGVAGPRPDHVSDSDPKAISQACQKDNQYVATPNVFNNNKNAQD